MLQNRHGIIHTVTGDGHGLTVFGGNAYDELDADGLLIHRYGPHIFHTNALEIFNHLSRFTAWRPYEHRVLAQVDGKLLPIPINLDTINKLYDLNLSSEQLEQFFAARPEGLAWPDGLAAASTLMPDGGLPPPGGVSTSCERSPVGVYEVGFQLGPRLNASGRLETAEASLELLLAPDVESALPLAEALDA
mgnify:CR=1 FL=1